jgi:hypothetical protein
VKSSVLKAGLPRPTGTIGAWDDETHEEKLIREQMNRMIEWDNYIYPQKKQASKRPDSE